MYSYRYAHCPRYTIIHSNRIIKNLIYEVVSKRWHNLFFTFYSPAIFSFAYDAFF